jgi:hypothetical protein
MADAVMESSSGYLFPPAGDAVAAAMRGGLEGAGGGMDEEAAEEEEGIELDVELNMKLDAEAWEVKADDGDELNTEDAYEPELNADELYGDAAVDPIIAALDPAVEGPPPPLMEAPVGGGMRRGGRRKNSSDISFITRPRGVVLGSHRERD